MVGKKGELTSQQIALLVLSIGGFILVLVFLGALYGGGEDLVDDEICRTSILTRATSPDALQAAVPLKCRTSKICISESGNADACPQFLGEDNVVHIGLSGSDAQKRDTIARVSANALHSCWTITGQGRLDLFGTLGEEFGFDRGATCLVCSRLAFADDVSDQLLATVDVQSYMERTPVPSGGGETYLSVLADNKGTRTFTDRGIDFPENTEITLEGGRDDLQIAIVFSQTKQIDWQEALLHLGEAAFAGTAAIPGAARKGGAIAFGSAAGFGLTVAGVGIGFGAVGRNAYLNQLAAAAYCGQFTSAVGKDDLLNGCSVVQAVQYNVRDINALCPASIQSIP